MEAAAKLREYTLTDRGIFLTLKATKPELTSTLGVFKEGGDEKPNDPLLNPAHVLLGTHIHDDNAKLAKDFVDWLIKRDGGQDVIKYFKKDGTDDYLYTMAPDPK